MILKAVTQYLAANACGTAGKSLFVNEMPSSCKEGALLLSSYGGVRINPELPKYYVTEFRMVTRSADYETGMALAIKISNTLTTHSGFTSGTAQVKQCFAMNLPRDYRRSAGGYWEFEVDFDINFVDIST